MILDRYTKQPRERLVFRIDYSKRYLGDEDLTGVSVEIRRRSGSADDSDRPFSVPAVFVESPKTVLYAVQGGAHGNEYQVTFFTSTTGTRLREDEIFFVVKEL